MPTLNLQKDEYVFRFPYQEAIPDKQVSSLKAGLDLGRKEPYTMVILNEENERVAHYVSTGRLKQISQKRERLLQEKKYLRKKIEAYEKLGLNSDVLQLELKFRRSKITKLGSSIEQLIGNEVSRKLSKHKLSTLKVENLSWVAGSKYGSRWNHSKQLKSVEHALLREGTRTVAVNPKNTSQVCGKCNDRITPNSKNRTVWCKKCKTRMDRDYNAALNIAKNLNRNNHAYLSGTGRTGTVVGLNDQTVEKTPSSFIRDEFFIT